MRIVIIDSGLDGIEYFNCNSIDGIMVSNMPDEKITEGYFQDDIGHGTAVTDILTSNIHSTKYSLFIVKIFTDAYQTDFRSLIIALEYINEFIKCDLILISSGIRIIEEYQNLMNVIDRLTSKNIVIVSAFDNNGSMSFPASFPNVIGVDTSSKYKSKEQFAVVENSTINIIGSSCSFRTKWINNKKNIVKGNSYTAAFITSLIADYIINRKQGSEFSQCMYFLRENASEVIKCKNHYDIHSPEAFFCGVKNAIIFPFNKEVHALANFEELLNFNVIDYYDIRQSGVIGMKINNILSHSTCEKKIKDFQNINWDENFDMVILSHVEELSDLLQYDLKQFFVMKCKQYQKKIYSFDDIELLANDFLLKEQYFIPKISSDNAVDYLFGKLYVSHIPVLGVYGTSPKQGKYTLQLLLKKIMESKGYKVSQLGTEPSGYLFGFEYVYPMGYNSTVYVNGDGAIAVLNDIMNKIEQTASDIIITGCQSGTVPLVNYNLNYFTLTQTEFILGTQPDLIILCVNLHDEFDYIKRTIKFIEGICESRVVAICIYPCKTIIDNGVVKKSIKINFEEYVVFSEKLYSLFRIPVFCLDDIDEINRQIDIILSTISNN